MSLFIQGGGFSVGPNGVCWDCPISSRQAASLFAAVVICTLLGIWLRRNDKTYLRTIGNCLLVFAALELFTLNHAGRNWGIIRFTNPVEFFDRDAISVLCGILAGAGALLAVYFRKRSGRTPLPLDKSVVVEFDNVEVRIRVIERMDPQFNPR